ncbi:MAG: hypothetical protein J6Z45_06185, partial [Oscillospiraceae bacterium]|nr:hypothetical protein [Oscillospiraceae bacterium]
METTRKHSLLGKVLRGGAVLAMAAMALPMIPSLSAEAANYELYVGGVQVTDTNKRDILPSDAPGVFSYNASTKTLTVSGDYTYDYGPVIESYI